MHLFVAGRFSGRKLNRVRLIKRPGALRPTTLAVTLQTLPALFAP